MSWEKGDLAICVQDGKWISFQYPLVIRENPKRGWIGVVAQVHPRSLEFEELGDDTFVKEGFRKIPPLTDEERDEFLADLRNDERLPA